MRIALACPAAALLELAGARPVRHSARRITVSRQALVLALHDHSRVLASSAELGREIGLEPSAEYDALAAAAFNARPSSMAIIVDRPALEAFLADHRRALELAERHGVTLQQANKLPAQQAGEEAAQ